MSSFNDRFDGSAKRWSIDRRKPVKMWFYAREVGFQSRPLDQAALQHFANVDDVALVTALNLRQRLSVQVEVSKDDRSDLSNEWTPIFPARRDRNEVDWRCQLEIDR